MNTSPKTTLDTRPDVTSATKVPILETPTHQPAPTTYDTMTNTPYSSCTSNPSAISERIADSCTTTATSNTHSRFNTDQFLTNGPIFISNLAPLAKSKPIKDETYDFIQVPHIPPDILEDTPREYSRSSPASSITIDTYTGDDEIENSNDNDDDSDDTNDSANTDTTPVKIFGSPKIIKHVFQNKLSAVYRQ